MTREEATRILDEVIPPPEHHTVDLDHLQIAQAWLCIKETLTAEPFNCSLEEFGECSYKSTGCADCEVKEKVRNAIDKAEPTKHGRWISTYEMIGYRCSVCGKGCDRNANYCPNCGAEMRVDE